MLFGRGGFWVDYQLRHGRYDAASEQEDWFNFQVSGPNAVYVVEKAADESVRDMKFMYSGVIHSNGREVRAAALRAEEQIRGAWHRLKQTAAVGVEG